VLQVTRQRILEGLVRLGYQHGSHLLQQALQPRPNTAASALVPAIEPAANPLVAQPQPDGTAGGER
jgi:hypothetical protein